MSSELGRRHGPSKPKEFGAIEAQQLDLGGVLPMTPALQIPGHLVFRPDLLPAARLLSLQPPSSSCPLLLLSSSFRLADNLLLDKFEIKAVHTFNQHTSHCPTASPVPTLRIPTPRYINSPRTGLIVAAFGIILRDPFSTSYRNIKIRYPISPNQPIDTMPPLRTIPAAKPVKTERTHEENQERFVHSCPPVTVLNLTSKQSIHRCFQTK